MKRLMESLIQHNDHNADPVYAADEIRGVATRVVEINRTGLLAVLVDDESTWVQVALFRFSSSNSDGSGVMHQLVMHGEGPSGPLREFRHSYWGEDGYIFYAPRKLIVGALDALKEWFDLD